jgi:CRP/FNR family transcriptional regulator
MRRALGRRGGSTQSSVERTLGALQACPLVSGLTHDEVAEIAVRSVLKCVDANHRVFAENEPCKGLWVITSGRVRLHHLMADGRQQVVGFHAPTTALNLSAALDGRPYMATATALENAEFVLIPRPLLSELGRLHPAIVRNAIDLLCLEVRQRDITTAVAALKDARGRIGCSLLQLARQFGVSRGAAIQIDYPLTRQHIADRSGVTVETAIRVMSEMQQRGVIRTDSQIIEILDITGIAASSSCEDCQFQCSVFAPPRGS